MKTNILLKIYIKENDKYEHESLLEKIIKETKTLDLAGITAYKAIMGYGPAKEFHSTKILRLSEDLPIVIEIIDTKNKITEILPVFNDILKKANCDGLITTQKIKINTYHKK